MNGTNYEFPHCGALSIPHSQSFWAKLLACFQISLALISPLMEETMFHNDIAQREILWFCIF